MPNSSTNTSGSSSTGNNPPPPPPPPPPRNRFLKCGSEGTYESIDTKKACVIRVDLPGCPTSDLEYWVDRNYIHFFADEPAMPDFGNAGRKYGGSLSINPETYDVHKAKAKLVNGVLWITIPKIPGTKATVDVTVEIPRCHVPPPTN